MSEKHRTPEHTMLGDLITLAAAGIAGALFGAALPHAVRFLTG
ncbi:MAG: hypothetical protein ACLFWF_10560 [Alphaproteobacteria bacterium]